MNFPAQFEQFMADYSWLKDRLLYGACAVVILWGMFRFLGLLFHRKK